MFASRVGRSFLVLLHIDTLPAHLQGLLTQGTQMGRVNFLQVQQRLERPARGAQRATAPIGQPVSETVEFHPGARLQTGYAVETPGTTKFNPASVFPLVKRAEPGQSSRVH
ncbi:hypothetical protein B8W72_30205 [Pseudomonas putida]|uniref:Uncharacterized protein n=1 Tax=Pseudomonas putida TaxID=303 RepID=A0A1Y3KCF1_PSEPU|nr:hypothetical protein B8W72_30205 [Pseudomonas putida]